MTKANFETDFLTSKAKKVFTHLQKAFTKVLILHYFDLKYHIHIETDILKYAISKILSQMTLDQPLTDYIIYKNHSDFLKSGIG